MCIRDRGKALDKPARPMLAIVAGSKVSTKLDVLNSLADICDSLIVGGGIANTFLAAAGLPVGKSLYEADLVETAKAIAAKVSVPLPVDVVAVSYTHLDVYKRQGLQALARLIVELIGHQREAVVVVGIVPLRDLPGKRAQFRGCACLRPVRAGLGEGGQRQQ